MDHRSLRNYKKKRRTQIIVRVLICGAALFAAAVLAAVLIPGNRKPEDMISNGEIKTPAVTPIDTADSVIPVETTLTDASEPAESAATDPSSAKTPVPEAGTDPVPEPEPEPDPEAMTEAEADPEPTPEADPGTVYLASLEGYRPGDVIDSDLIDKGNLKQYFSIREIQEGDPVYQRIYGRSFVNNNDIPLSGLRYLTMLHVNFDGQYQVGEMIVNASVAEQVTEIFRSLCGQGYEICSMYLIDDFWVGNGTDSDTNSIDHNNTSCFFYRPATGSSHISRHALGLAIDLNPQQNPYVTIRNDGSLSYAHANAAAYVSGRSSDTPHVITETDPAYRLFTSNGWTWGGNWNNPKDYQHFQYE